MSWLLRLLSACSEPSVSSEPAKPIDIDKVSIELVVDTSGSMSQAIEGEEKMALAKTNLMTLLEGYREYDRQNPGKLEVGLVGFNDDARSVVPLASFDYGALASGVQSLSSHGGTAIGEGLLTSESNLDRFASERKYIILLTDGENTDGVSPGAALTRINDGNETANDWKTSTHIIAFDTDREYFEPLKEKGAAIYGANNASELDIILRRTQEIMLEAY